MSEASSSAAPALVNRLWRMCELLRGTYRRDEFGKVILPLLVLRRLDCVVTRAREDGGSPLPGAAAVREHVPIDNSSGLGFGTFRQAPGPLDATIRHYIAGFSPQVQEILDGFALARELPRLHEKGVLPHLVTDLSLIDLSPVSVSNEVMGRVFEELVSLAAGANYLGEHYTPREVVQLMVELVLAGDIRDCDRGRVQIYDPTCGTGGMLSMAESHIHTLAPRVMVEALGQDVNPEAWAICRADALLKGRNPESVRLGDTLTDDRFPGRTFDYMLANPPFGVQWKEQRAAVEGERQTLGYAGRFGAGTPRLSDGSLLFLQHMLAKMRPPEEGGSRIGAIFNASPLFSGDAGSGESEIRRWIIEQDWLEAIVGLPEQLFINTGIGTYIWILTNRKDPRRRGKVQLIDGREFYVPVRGVGHRRRKLGTGSGAEENHVAEIARIHRDFIDGATRTVIEERRKW